METADGTSLHTELTPIPARTASNIVTFDAALQALLIAWTNCLKVIIFHSFNSNRYENSNSFLCYSQNNFEFPIAILNKLHII